MPPSRLQSRVSLAIAALSLAASAPRLAAQTAAPAPARRLADRLASPLLYLAVVPGAPAVRGFRTTELLRDRAWIEAFGLAGRGELAALALLDRVLEGAEAAGGEIELALTGIVPRPSTAGLPRMVFRAELSAEAAERMRTLLRRPDLAQPARSVGGATVYALDGWLEARPGGSIEAAVAGDELFVSNHSSAMEQVLTGGEAPAEALAVLPAYRALRDQLEIAAGTVLLYADVARLRPRLGMLLDDEAHWLLRWSGLASTQRAACAIRASSHGLHTTILLDDGGEPDGWIALAKPRRIAELLPRVPHSGLGGVAFAVEPTLLLAPDRDGWRGGYGAGLRALRNSLISGCRKLGLDADRQIVRRLEGSLAVGVVQRGSSPARVEPVFALHAKSTASARSILNDCRQLAATSEKVAIRPDGEQVVLRPDRGHPLYLGVRRDALVMAFDGAVLDDALAPAAPQQPNAMREILASLQRLGRHKTEALGVFHLDLSSLLANGGQHPPSYVLRRHVGLLQRHPQGTRIELLTPM